MDALKQDRIRTATRKNYAKVAKSSGCCCTPGCCSPGEKTDSGSVSTALGYSNTDIDTVPDGANMGLGCGNPQAIASLKPGEIVLDLGCGGGFDCFLAAKKIGPKGLVIGVDMTPEMVSKARDNVAKGDYPNIDIRLGEIENLPVADNSVDVIISNCVINLSPDKMRVFQEAYRVLKSGGRLAVSDVVAFKPLPDHIRTDLALHVGCVAGASTVFEVETMLKSSGFAKVSVETKKESAQFIKDWAPGKSVEEYVVSADIRAVK